MSRWTDPIRRAVANRARQRCEYCQTHQFFQTATFHVEHIIPRSRGGTDDLENLAFACPRCNLMKSSLVMDFDPLTGLMTALYHPRQDRWSSHFFWVGVMLQSKTAVGRVTIDRLRLNSEQRQRIRDMEHWFGLFPPDDVDVTNP